MIIEYLDPWGYGKALKLTGTQAVDAYTRSRSLGDRGLHYSEHPSRYLG